ncbi:hypothetical protein CYMTET_11401 [Cymbomonas tetramitiformis]|uniref:Uncharacterized protein n=1 Tax=Cymbomonas tetramitiformis TaxID=36881 RepID=A0AAE0GMC8_9CHLO|nr:hypothetical protein CYMTET_11401 [Cymbomonas tetramitiformis]
MGDHAAHAHSIDRVSSARNCGSGWAQIRSTAGAECIDMNGYDTIKLPPGSAKAGSVKGERIRVFTKNAIRSSHQADVGEKGTPKMQEGSKSKKLRSRAPRRK